MGNTTTKMLFAKEPEIASSLVQPPRSSKSQSRLVLRGWTGGKQRYER